MQTPIAKKAIHLLDAMPRRAPVHGATDRRQR
jgi:hypothetical protein